MVITIDGPVASGKSSVAQALAQRLGFYYLNTGMLYRAVAYVLIQQGKIPSAQNIGMLADCNLDFIQEFSYEYRHDKTFVFYQGRDLTPFLYDDLTERISSIISSYRPIRQELLTLQQSIAQKHDIVADGRDCGTVVFPHAQFKFFLTADADVRAQRLFNDQKRTHTLSLQEIKVGLCERDERDKTRQESPLTVADDAVVIDNSALNFEQTITAFLSAIKRP
jgi:CMP/dCMP kinase